MAGVQNQIGQGQAQVLSEGPSHFPLAQQLFRQKAHKEEQDRYNRQLKEREEQDLYNLVGSALNLRDFNPVIHDRVRKAQSALTQKILTEGGNLKKGELLLEAQNQAGLLTQTSQKLNAIDQQLAATKKEYEGDKRINSANLEKIARKKVLDQLNETGDVDPNINYIDDALNEYPEFALTDKSDYTLTNFIPQEKQSLSGKFTEINKAGRTDKFDWKVDTYPAFYDFKDNGEEKEPTVTTRSKPSGLKDEQGNDVPMLADDAYGRFAASPSNVAALNLRLKKQYGKDLNLRSSEAETLRKVEAFKDVERQKPRVNKSVIEKEAPIRSHSFYFGSGAAPGQTQVNDVYNRIKVKLKNRQLQGQQFLPASLLEQDEKDEVLKIARNALKDEDITQEELKIIEGNDGSIRIFSKDDNFIAFLGETATNLPRQADVKGKREVVAESNKKKTSTKKDSLGIR